MTEIGFMHFFKNWETLLYQAGGNFSLCQKLKFFGKILHKLFILSWSILITNVI